MSLEQGSDVRTKTSLSEKEKETIEINKETIKDGVWRPSVFEQFGDSLGVGASTKELKRIINRENARIRVTAKQDRFDKSFSEESSETRENKIGAGRIIVNLLKRIASEADPHDIQKTALEHSNNIITVDQEHLNKKKEKRARILADGMITNLKKIPLMVSGADCAPVGIYDSQHQAIGVFHSGWRGTLKQISRKGIEAMSKNYDSKAEELLAVVGPRADGERFEVDEKVRKEFLNAKNQENKPIYTSEEVETFFRTNPDKPGFYFLDTGLAIKTSLIKAGVPEEHIQLSQYSTMSQKGNQLFSSERIEGREARDSFAFIMTLK